jgi:hypothetical protein
MNDPKDDDKSGAMELYFLPTDESAMSKAAEGIRKRELPNLGKFAEIIRNQFAESEVETWEITIEGTLKAGGGLFPAEAGLKGTLKLSNK